MLLPFETGEVTWQRSPCRVDGRAPGSLRAARHFQSARLCVPILAEPGADTAAPGQQPVWQWEFSRLPTVSLTSLTFNLHLGSITRLRFAISIDLLSTTDLYAVMTILHGPCPVQLPRYLQDSVTDIVARPLVAEDSRRLDYQFVRGERHGVFKNRPQRTSDLFIRNMRDLAKVSFGTCPARHELRDVRRPEKESVLADASPLHFPADGISDMSRNPGTCSLMPPKSRQASLEQVLMDRPLHLHTLDDSLSHLRERCLPKIRVWNHKMCGFIWNGDGVTLKVMRFWCMPVSEVSRSTRFTFLSWSGRAVGL